MHDLIRLARILRSDAADPNQTFNHRIRIGIIVAALILLLSHLR